jgi:hypothetical protein
MTDKEKDELVGGIGIFILIFIPMFIMLYLSYTNV